RLLKETLDNGLTLSYTYDRLQRQTSLTLPDGSSIHYRYDALTLQEVTRKSPSGQTLYSATYLRHNGRSLPLEIELPNHEKISHTYDGLGRRIAIQSTHFSQQLTYDALGNLTHLAQSDPEGTLEKDYTYDDLYQLISDEEHTYTYDSLHNRLTQDNQSYTLSELNELLQSSTATFTYDALGRPQQRTDPETTYTFDSLDRLIAIETPTTHLECHYDPFHRRTFTQHNSQERRYLFEDQNELGFYSDTQSHLRILGKGLGAEIGAALALELN
ncbi:unnamed protein product, partial [marine sediment metagenome]